MQSGILPAPALEASVPADEALYRLGEPDRSRDAPTVTPSRIQERA